LVQKCEGPLTVKEKEGRKKVEKSAEANNCTGRVRGGVKPAKRGRYLNWGHEIANHYLPGKKTEKPL